MRIAIIGRTEVLYDTAQALLKDGHEIALVITSKEAPEYTRTSNDFKLLAEKLCVPFLHTAKITDALDLIKSQEKIDIAVSINYSGIIPQEIIDCFPLGILNAHGGDLPRYRGNACQAWAILNGEDKIGLCVHRMIGGELDNGDILARDYFPLNLNVNITEVMDWIKNETPRLYQEALLKLSKDPDFVLERQSKDPSDALRCYPRKPEDGSIDWTASAEQVIRLVNACNKPYPGAFCLWQGQKMVIWKAELAPAEIFCAVPGQVMDIGVGYIDVATGKGKVRISSIATGDDTVTPDRLIKSIRERLM